MSDVEPYKLYLLDQAGRIFRASWLEAESDGEALAKVRAMSLRSPAEIWQLNRKVAVVPSSNDLEAPGD